jgi:uncharacterized membrane protein required for colicin V production
VTITFFDILLLLGLLGGAVLGFFRGVLRQAAATVILYISIVVSALFYRNVSRVLVRLTGQSPNATDVLSFFLLMGLTLGVLFIVRHELMGDVDTAKQKIWSNITGMLFGFLNAAIICAVAVIIVRSVSSGDPWPAYEGMQRFLLRQTSSSWMAYTFTPFSRLLLALVEPLLFGSRLPPLLRNAL